MVVEASQQLELRPRFLLAEVAQRQELLLLHHSVEEVVYLYSD